MSRSAAPILVVDDEESVRRYLSVILKRTGYPVFTASNGEEALELARERTFAVVVLDIFMPRKGGFEALIEFKERHPATKILVISGGRIFSAATPLEMALSLGAHAVLIKPFRTREFLDAVHQLT